MRQKDVITFTLTDPNSKLFLRSGDDTTETTSSYKYLGLIFHNSGNFTIARDHLAKQANKAAQAIRRTFRNDSIRVDASTQLFDSLVLPILTHGWEVWYPHTEQLAGDPIDTLFKIAQGANSHTRTPTLNL